MQEQVVEATKACPFCGEQILAVAIKCKHCQSSLTTAPPPATSTASVPVARQGDTYGVLLALAPWVGVALCWLWVGESPLLTAGSNLQVLGGVVVIGTALLAAMDASALGFGVKGSAAEKASGPGATFTLVALLWFIMYPAHVHARAKFAGRKPAVANAVIGMLAFVLSLGYLAYLIEEKLQGIRNALY